MAFDHVGFSVADFPASRTFYTAALAPLGWTTQMEGDGWSMMGPEGKRAFWFGVVALAGPPPGHIHLAISAPDRAAVDAFHAAALAAGGADNGAPGLRPQYHPDYYAAFITDLNGHNLEAVCHAPGPIA
jgi:catechol 2,3-dioxygenase-like lactoylglutathione lyase family enzyme